MPDPRPLTVEVDLAHGGRWTSLRTPEREWLWRHPDPAVAAARAAVAPGAAFVDAGGVEECLPTVRGEPDHGAVWSRPWSATGVAAGGFRLDRRIRGDGAVTVDYTITGPPHAPVVHAVHALLDVSPAARLDALGVRTAHLVDQHSVVPWPGGLDRLGPDVVAAAFGSAGERCMAISAAVTVGDAGDGLVQAVTEKARKVRVGPGRDAASEMGPVVTAQARDRINGLIGTGADQGAALTVDGRGYVVDGHEDGFWVGPTVIDRVTPEMDVYREEIFGPVLSVVRVRTVDDAIALINSNPYGNGTAIFTSSGEAARRFQRGVQVGMIGINVPIPVPMAYYSFGGWKDSLFGDKHVHGPEGVSFYTRAKVVTSRWPSFGNAGQPIGASYHFPTNS